MNKKLFLMCLVGLMSVTSAYAKCDGGTEVTNSVGTTFCKSNVAMNWWSGAAWCKANGMRLATMYEMCPSWNGGKGANRCPELKIDGGNVMSATASGSGGAFIVIMSSGEVRSGYGYFQRHNAACAFCI